MILQDTLRKLEKDAQFRKWWEAHEEVYLAHAFTMLDEKEKKFRWELGFYDPGSDKLTVVETDPAVAIRQEEEVFKREGTVAPLDMKSVAVSVSKAMQICDELLKEKYSAHVITKRIILLQNIGLQMYNVTLVTLAYALLNIKIDAKTGMVISHNLQSIMGLGEWQKGTKGN